MIAAENDKKMYRDRALRVRTIRGMLRMTVAEFANLLNYATPTITQWEKNPLNGLSEKGARNIIEVLKGTEVVCDLNWLLHGQGIPPFIRSENQVIAKYQQELLSLSSGIDSITYTNNEIERFRTFVPNAVIMEVPDDSMEPLYSAGEFVGGKELRDKALQQALGKVCIVKVSENQTLLRKLFKDEKNPEKYRLACVNQRAAVETVLSNVNVLGAAPVARIWRKIIE